MTVVYLRKAENFSGFSSALLGSAQLLDSLAERKDLSEADTAQALTVSSTPD